MNHLDHAFKHLMGKPQRYLSSHDITAGRAFTPLSISMDEVDEDFVRKRVEESNSHAVITEELQTMFPGLRGLSERSFRRFCTDRGISRRCSLTKEELERCVSDAVSEVSTSYISIGSCLHAHYS